MERCPPVGFGQRHSISKDVFGSKAEEDKWYINKFEKSGDFFQICLGSDAECLSSELTAFIKY